MAGQKGGAKQLVWLTYERSRSHHLGCIIQANNPKGDCDLRARANQSLRSHFSVEHAITVGWTVAAPLAPNAERPAFLSLPISPAVYLLITNH